MGKTCLNLGSTVDTGGGGGGAGQGQKQYLEVQNLGGSQPSASSSSGGSGSRGKLQRASSLRSSFRSTRSEVSSRCKESTIAKFYSPYGKFKHLENKGETLV